MSFNVSFERAEDYECGAALLSVIASATPLDEARTFQRYLSLCGRALWSKQLAVPEDSEPIRVKPQYVFRDAGTIDRDVSFVNRRFGQRMVAGRMAIPFLWRALDASNPLPTEIRRLSINQMAEFVSADAGQAEAINVERRYWSPSRPVIHLAVAAAHIGQQLQKNGQTFGLESLLLNRATIEAVVVLAGLLEMIIANDPKFPVNAEQLIRFRLT